MEWADARREKAQADGAGESGNSINFNRYDDIQISDYIKRCDDMLTLESRMAHKQYYKAIITIEKYLNLKIKIRHLYQNMLYYYHNVTKV